MSDPRYEKLIELWQAGQIDEEKFKRGLVLIRSLSAVEEVQQPTQTEVQVSTNALPWMNWRALAFACLIIGVGVCLVLVWLVEIGVVKRVYADGTAGWMAFCLATTGVFLALNRHNSALVSISLFALALTSPMWEGKSRSVLDDEIPGAARTLYPSYTRAITKAEFGGEWPFPAFKQGVLRCDRASVGGVRRPVVTIELGGLKYGLNGAAQDFGFPDIRSQMAKNQKLGTYELGASDKMIAGALGECN